MCDFYTRVIDERKRDYAWEPCILDPWKLVFSRAESEARVFCPYKGRIKYSLLTFDVVIPCLCPECQGRAGWIFLAQVAHRRGALEFHRTGEKYPLAFTNPVDLNFFTTGDLFWYRVVIPDTWRQEFQCIFAEGDQRPKALPPAIDLPKVEEPSLLDVKWGQVIPLDGEAKLPRGFHWNITSRWFKERNVVWRRLE